MPQAQRPFRFGVVMAPQAPEQWQDLARRVEQLGYATLLMPDGLQLLSSFPTLAVAATVTSRLRVGSFVLASPLRPPYLAAWEAHSLATLTDGRFEMGIGTGRPEVAQQAQELLGLPSGSPAQRLTQVEQTIDHLRTMEKDGERHTPVMVAASGPRALKLAAAKADIVALATSPMASRDEFGQRTGELWDAAGSRADQVELSMNLFVVGDEVPPWVQRFLSVDAATLIAHDSLTVLRGTPDQMADELRRRRDAYGISYVTVNGAFVDALAPVVERLTGR